MMVAAIVTPAFLSSIRAHPHLPTNVYYFLVGATLSTLNLAHEIPHVLTFALANDWNPGLGRNEKLEIARKMREAIIKLAPIAGLPKAPYYRRNPFAAKLIPQSSQSMR